MNVRIHIERLILDGAALTNLQAEGLQSALETELSRLVMEGNLSREIATGGAVREMSVAARTARDSRTPAGIGRQIALAMYGGIGEEKQREKQRANTLTPATLDIPSQQQSQPGAQRSSRVQQGIRKKEIS